jgi:hypothetical protein
MEQRGTTMASLADLDDLRDLVARPWPFLSAYLAFEPPTQVPASGKAEEDQFAGGKSRASEKRQDRHAQNGG